jgi:hydroxymethylpyrimidine/phosphomethylpyrimidine kinase
VIPVALTIAGSDPSGGAGLQADLKTFHQHGVYGCSVVTLLTVQNTQSVSAVEILQPIFITQQLHAVLEDIVPQAAKTGALGNVKVIEAIAIEAALFHFPLVIDPVMISKHGDPLIDKDAVDCLIEKLLPRACLVTPNLHEAGALTGIEVQDIASLEKAAQKIAAMGSKNVLIKGGHHPSIGMDVLWSGDRFYHFPTQRIDTQNTHGTGCAFSAAITARLARGESLIAAVEGAKRFIHEAIRTNPGLGRGVGPINLNASA